MADNHMNADKYNTGDSVRIRKDRVVKKWAGMTRGVVAKRHQEQLDEKRKKLVKKMKRNAEDRTE